MMSELSAVLQKLSANVAQPKPNVISYGAAEFIEDIRRKLANIFPKEEPAVEWDVQLQNANLQIDPQLVQEALLELFDVDRFDFLARQFLRQQVGKAGP